MGNSKKNKKKKDNKLIGYPIYGINYFGGENEGSDLGGGDVGGIGESKLEGLIREIFEEFNKGIVSEMPRDFDRSMLTYDKIPSEVIDNFNKNITISVAFVKKDGSIRHMAFRKRLNAYIKSDSPKTELQSNILQNNNLLQVYDTNLYIKSKKDGNSDSDAARSSYRRVTLDNVLGFLTGGKFYDTRGINKILERYGEDVYNSLTKNMKVAMQNEIKKIDKDMSL